MKKLQRMLMLLLTAAFVLTLTACGSQTEAGPSTGSDGNAPQDASDGVPQANGYGDVLIGIILPLGGLGDNSVADGCYGGIQKAQEKLGFEFDYSEPQNEQDRETILIDYCEADEYDLIITVGDESLDLVTSIQPNYPEQKFLIYNPEQSLDNTISEYFNKADMGFLAGAFIALMDPYGELSIGGKSFTWTPSGKMGLIIGGEYPSTVPVLTSAAAGARYVNPNFDYMYGIVGGWMDQAKNKELALSMYNGGCSFIFHNSGAGSAGLISAAEEVSRFVVGYDVNQNEQSSFILASSYKSHEDVVTRVLTEFCESGGELAWGTSEINDFSNGGVGFTYSEDVEIPDEVRTAMEAIQEKISNKEIDIPVSWDEVAAFTDTFDA